MKIKLGLLAGFVRPIPDVRSFVTPVFLGNDDIHYLQDVRNHIVIGFTRTTFGEEFQSVASHHAVRIGDRALYGFENAPECVAMACAWELASFLRDEKMAEHTELSDAPHTARAVGRFCDTLYGLDQHDGTEAHPLLHFAADDEGLPWRVTDDAPVAVIASASRRKEDHLVIEDVFFRAEELAYGDATAHPYKPRTGRRQQPSHFVPAAPSDIVNGVTFLSGSNQEFWQGVGQLSSTYYALIVSNPQLGSLMVCDASRIQADFTRNCLAHVNATVSYFFARSEEAGKVRAREQCEMKDDLRDLPNHKNSQALESPSGETCETRSRMRSSDTIRADACRRTAFKT